MADVIEKKFFEKRSKEVFGRKEKLFRNGWKLENVKFSKKRKIIQFQTGYKYTRVP